MPRFKRNLLTLTLALIAGSTALTRADDIQVLFSTKNDIAPDYIFDIYVKTDGAGKISGFGYMNHSTRAKTEWSLGQVSSGVDIVNPLDMKLGRFKATSLDPEVGGCINLQTRDSLVFPSFPDFFISIMKINEHWEVQNAKTRKSFNSVMLRSNGNTIYPPETSWSK